MILPDLAFTSTSGGYRCLVADPPWHQEPRRHDPSEMRRKARPQRHYATMGVPTIAALPVAPLAAPSAHLWLWCLTQHVDWGYTVARAWDFEPLTLLTWVKPGLGVGRFQCNTEHILLCRCGSQAGAPFGRTAGTAFAWRRGPHSRKPSAFYELVERCSPGPYLELFARRTQPAWDAWGDQVVPALWDLPGAVGSRTAGVAR